MQVGSLVIWIGKLPYTNVITPNHNEIYTVRQLCSAVSHENPKPHLGIYLDEIQNNTCPISRGEMCYVGSHFREIQSPHEVNVAELVEEIFVLSK